MNKIKFISFILGFLLFSCEELFDTSLDIVPDQLIVYGRVSNLKYDTFVDIGRTIDRKSKPVPVTEAEVFILDSEGTRIDLCEKVPGSYTPLNTEFVGKVGSDYQLFVKLGSGRSFQSSIQTLPPSIGIDSVYAEYERIESISESGFAVETNVLKMQLDTEIKSESLENVYVRWDLVETFLINQTTRPQSFPPPEYIQCFVTRNSFSQNIMIQSSDNLTSSEIRVDLGERTIDYAFDYKFAFSYFQRAITKESYEYWTNIGKVSSVSGSIFNSPPATVPGNISAADTNDEVVLGYFEATGSSMKRLFFYRNDFPFFIDPACDWSRRKERYPGYCIDCLKHEESTYDAPEWFLVDSLFFSN